MLCSVTPLDRYWLKLGFHLLVLMDAADMLRKASSESFGQKKIWLGLVGYGPRLMPNVLSADLFFMLVVNGLVSRIRTLVFPQWP